MARIAALDLGSVRVGLAISDELGVLAHPRPPLDGADPRRLLDALRALVADEGVDRFLVGLPLSMSGEEGPGARRARSLAQQIADATGCDVELVDERLTTVEAARRLDEGSARSQADPRKARGRPGRARTRAAQTNKVDGAAAAVLLQGWLDARR
jgi:putative Holliday junction resolvase